MARFRGSPINVVPITICASVFLLMATASVAFGDDLKGYSVDATYTTHAVSGVVIAGELPRHGLAPVLHHDRVYISLLGNVFDYSDSFGGAFAGHRKDETHLDKAKALSRKRLRAWTVESGRLLGIVHVIEGTVVETFAIDPSTSTCTVSYQTYPDQNTGRTVMQFLDGVTGEIKAFNVSSMTCAVQKGNIFATDQ